MGKANEFSFDDLDELEDEKLDAFEDEEEDEDEFDDDELEMDDEGNVRRAAKTPKKMKKKRNKKRKYMKGYNKTNRKKINKGMKKVHKQPKSRKPGGVSGTRRKCLTPHARGKGKCGTTYKKRKSRVARIARRIALDLL